MFLFYFIWNTLKPPLPDRPVNFHAIKCNKHICLFFFVCFSVLTINILRKKRFVFWLVTFAVYIWVIYRKLLGVVLTAQNILVAWAVSAFCFLQLIMQQTCLLYVSGVIVLCVCAFMPLWGSNWIIRQVWTCRPGFQRSFKQECSDVRLRVGRCSAHWQKISLIITILLFNLVLK